MKVDVIAVGTKMPAWVVQASAEYCKRLQSDLPLNFIEVPLAQRGKGQSSATWIEREGELLLAKVPKSSFVVALEVSGRALSTGELAAEIEKVGTMGRDLVLLVGGPDGLSDGCRARADALWSLSKLTLPHPLVRVILAEQVYRAVSVIKGHPYHRE
jgi:23S rRNA (pseudouridine1915-N3)-methyltransferase